MPQGPTSIKVVSILGIIYAGIWLLMVPCGVFLQYHPLQPNPAIDAMNRDPVYMANYLVSVAIWLGLSVLLLVGSIASLKLKAYGRKAMLIFAWGHIAYAVMSLVISFILVMPRMEAAFAADPKLAPAAAMMKIMGVVMAIGVTLFYGVISGVIIYFFNRKVAVDAFKGIFPAEPTSFPVDYTPQPPG